MSNIYRLTIVVFILLQAIAVQAQNPATVTHSFTNAIGVKLQYILPATFTMGTPPTEQGRHKDEVQHRVTISKGYYIGITEVTQVQWRKVMGSSPSALEKCGENCPVESVSWHDVQSFIRKLNEMEGTNTYRLPTEAEWEYACRAGTTTPFSFGKCLSSNLANYDARHTEYNCPEGKYRKKTVSVAQYPPNAWELYDMHGNVWEWCQDWYAGKTGRDEVDPKGPPSGKYRVIRGGGWDFLDHDCRSANRDRSAPDRRINTIGFRIVKSP